MEKRTAHGKSVLHYPFRLRLCSLLHPVRSMDVRYGAGCATIRLQVMKTNCTILERDPYFFIIPQEGGKFLCQHTRMKSTAHGT